MRLLLLVAGICVAVPGRAQPRYGGEIAARATDLAGQIESDRELSLAIAGVIELPLAPMWSVAAEPGIGSAGSAKYDLLYAAVPIVARFRYPIAQHWNLRTTAGFGLNVLLKAELVSADDDGDVRESIRDHVRWWDANVIAGVGVERGRLFLELRYKRGLATVSADDGGLHIVTTELGLWIGAVR